MSNPLHDFTAGPAATFLKEKRQLEFIERGTRLESVQEMTFSHEEIRELPNGITVYEKNASSSFLFWYKNRPNPRYGLPKYHVLKCRTMKSYGGFVAANSMPVSITLRNGTTSESLNLCKNCQSLVFKQGFFKTYLGKDKQWHDVVLTLVEKLPPDQQVFSSDGYLSNWSQVSEAYRQSVDWCCENPVCRVDLSDPAHRKYLHTHHLRGTKRNSRQDLEALCLLCHAMEHPEKMGNGSGIFNVQDMVGLFRARLDPTKVKAFEKLMASFTDRFDAGIGTD